MKKRLNLFSVRKLPVAVVNYYSQTKKYALIVMLLVLISYGVMYVASYFIQTNISKVKDSTASYEKYVSNNRALSQDLKKFTYKYGLLKNFSAGDVRGYEYLDSLQKKIEGLGITLDLDSFSIDSSRRTEFTITFPNYESAIAFIENLESAIFQEAFETLTLDSFNLSSSSQDSFSLTFSGVFTALKI